MKCHICTYWTPEKGCDHYHAAVREVVSYSHCFNLRIVETDDFVSGIKHTIKYFEWMSQFTKSEQEVISSLNGGRRLPRKGINGIGNHKRHESAIESLKNKGVIVKDKNNILKLNTDIKIQFENMCEITFNR